MIIRAEVDRLFKELNTVRGTIARNPITGGKFLPGTDPVKPQKEAARRALLAREYFAIHGPRDAPALPLSDQEVEDYRNAGGLVAIVGFFARSAAADEYDFVSHPPFDVFARGLMASDISGWSISRDRVLLIRFRPRKLEGMGPDLRWRPPGEHTKFMKMVARSNSRLAA